MQVVKQYPDGVFSWVDLSAADQEGAKAFYNALFGWQAEDRPTDMGTAYTMWQIEGKNVAGMGEMSAEMKAQGMPAYWTSYIKHDDVDGIAAKVSEAGGNVLLPPMEVMDSGRMIIAQDPTGAAFGVWQPREHIGAQLVNRPNTLVWNELQTPNAETAKVFYGEVFDWTNESDDSGYVMYRADGRMHAGMLQMDESWGEAPPNWAVYFMVEDVSAMMAKAEELGGSVMVPETAAGELGKFAILQDPQGGVFTVMSFDGPVDAPPGYEQE